jgi:hypothetical protein
LYFFLGFWRKKSANAEVKCGSNDEEKKKARQGLPRESSAVHEKPKILYNQSLLHGSDRVHVWPGGSFEIQ